MAKQDERTFRYIIIADVVDEDGESEDEEGLRVCVAHGPAMLASRLDGEIRRHGHFTEVEYLGPLLAALAEWAEKAQPGDTVELADDRFQGNQAKVFALVWRLHPGPTLARRISVSKRVCVENVAAPPPPDQVKKPWNPKGRKASGPPVNLFPDDDEDEDDEP